jgi:hypothetical protein
MEINDLRCFHGVRVILSHSPYNSALFVKDQPVNSPHVDYYTTCKWDCKF